MDKDGKEKFFEESFLLADVKPDIVLRMPFLIMINADVNFQARDLQRRSYPTEDILPTTRWVELIEKKEFAAIALNPEHKTFIIYVATLSINSDNEMHSSKTA